MRPDDTVMDDKDTAYRNGYEDGLAAFTEDRAQIASFAMMGVLANPQMGMEWTPDEVAEHATLCADALLAKLKAPA